MRKAESGRSLHRDERGAVMVTGVFMACFLVGALWYVMGIGDAIVFRDRVQEATDHAAFTSAALHAKGMNFIAACNIVMLALVAVHVILGIIHDFALAACILSLGAGCGGWASARRIYEGYARFFKPSLTMIHELESAAAVGYPWIGAVKAWEIGGAYGKRGKIGDVDVVTVSASMVPIGDRPGLPVKPRRFEALCEKLGNTVFDWTKEHVALPGTGVVGRVVSELLGGDTIDAIVKKIIGAVITFRYCNPLFDPASSNAAQARYRREVARGEDKIAEINATADADNAKGGLRPGDPGYRRRVEPPKLEQGPRRGAWRPMLDPGFDEGWGGPGPHVPSAANGSELGKVWAIALRPTYLDADERKVQIASRRARGQDEQPGNFYFAEAELYFDCTSTWSDDTCNGSAFSGDSHAGYAIRWRARLRRLELPNVGQLLVDFTFDAVTSDPRYKFPKDALERGPIGALGLGAMRLALGGAFRVIEGWVQGELRDAASTPGTLDGIYH